jgi:hypothetical protein
MSISSIGRPLANHQKGIVALALLAASTIFLLIVLLTTGRMGVTGAIALFLGTLAGSGYLARLLFRNGDLIDDSTSSTAGARARDVPLAIRFAYWVLVGAGAGMGVAVALWLS